MIALLWSYHYGKIGVFDCFKRKLYLGEGVFLVLDATDFYGRIDKCYFKVFDDSCCEVRIGKRSIGGCLNDWPL